MTARNTSTGHVLEQMVRPALRRGGYSLLNNGRQVVVGHKPNGKPYRADVVAVSPAGKHYIISLKWQQTSGTAEQKVPFELISLLHILRARRGAYHKAYLVLGGPGWSLREFYVSGGLRSYITTLPTIGPATFPELAWFIHLSDKQLLAVAGRGVEQGAVATDGRRYRARVQGPALLGRMAATIFNPHPAVAHAPSSYAGLSVSTGAGSG